MQVRAQCAVPIGAVALAVMLILPACKKAPEQVAPAASEGLPSTPSPAVPAPAAAPSTPTPTALMKEHFSKVNEMKAAVVRGDLAAFREAAELLATRQLSGEVAEEWKVHLQAMQNAAGMGRDAADIAVASTALGDTGRACAKCHQALGKGRPVVEVGSPPAEGSGAALHMVRHQWAVDRMWEGLMGPSEDAWVKGSEVLGDAPLHQEAIAKGKTVIDRVGALAKETHALANRARTAPVDERGKMYGALLGTCTKCHTELGVKMK